MCAYTPPYQLTDAILRLSTEIAATVKEITVRGNLSAQPQLHRANRIRSVHSSLAIEHNSLTLDQVTALLTVSAFSPRSRKCGKCKMLFEPMICFRRSIRTPSTICSKSIVL